MQLGFSSRRAVRWRLRPCDELPRVVPAIEAAKLSQGPIGADTGGGTEDDTFRHHERWGDGSRRSPGDRCGFYPRACGCLMQIWSLSLPDLMLYFAARTMGRNRRPDAGNIVLRSLLK